MIDAELTLLDALARAAARLQQHNLDAKQRDLVLVIARELQRLAWAT